MALTRRFLAEAGAGLQLLARLPSFLRNPIDPESARARVRQRLEGRDALLLAAVRRAAFGRGAGPYRLLFAEAGCEWGDVERLVRGRGVEGALTHLAERGIYLTVDEFKGRRPTRRGRTEITISPDDLATGRRLATVPSATGGSSGGPRTSIAVDLAYIAERAVDLCVDLHARAAATWVPAIWEVPGGAAMVHVIELARAGLPAVRWFSQLRPAEPDLHPRYRWSARALVWASRAARIPVARPEFVSLDDPRPIVRWMADTLAAGRTPLLKTYPSSAVRVCQTGRAEGRSLAGAQFLVTGEPLTGARLETIQAVGAHAIARYGASECGLIGHGCLAPTKPDEVHLFHDLYALVHPPDGTALAGLRGDSVLISTLNPASPFTFLNLSLGDRATIERRACGCPLESAGWSWHLHGIQSYEKLTAGGMTFFDADVVRILDEILPRRFGGGPTDYQLVEDEDEAGRPRLHLVVSPAVGPIEESAVVDAFLDALGPGSGVERVMALQWRESAFLRVERRPPYPSPTGKILHLHRQRSAPSPSSG